MAHPYRERQGETPEVRAARWWSIFHAAFLHGPTASAYQLAISRCLRIDPERVEIRKHPGATIEIIIEGGLPWAGREEAIALLDHLIGEHSAIWLRVLPLMPTTTLAILAIPNLTL